MSSIPVENARHFFKNRFFKDDGIGKGLPHPRRTYIIQIWRSVKKEPTPNGVGGAAILLRCPAASSAAGAFLICRPLPLAPLPPPATGGGRVAPQI